MCDCSRQDSVLSINQILNLLSSLQINCVFFGITMKVLWVNQRKTQSEKVNANAETVKYA